MLNLSEIENLGITGSNGFVGKSIIQYISKLSPSNLPERITLITRSGLNFQIPKSLQTRTREFQQDLRDPWLLPSSISHILNLATDGSANSYSEAACYDFSRINENLVTWLAKQNIKTTVFHASSGAVFGDKAIRGENTRVDVKDTFRENRRQVEQLLIESAKELNFDLRIGRLFTFAGINILEKNQYAISNFIRSAINDKLITLLGDPQTQRSFLHQDAMCEWILTSLTCPYPYTDIQIGSNISIEIGELADYVALQTNSRVKYPHKYDPGDIYIPNNTNTRIKLGVEEGLNWKDAVLEMIAEARMSISGR